MSQTQTIVAKVGSSTLCSPDGTLDVAYIQQLCAQLADLHDAGNRVVLVSSGAAAAGMARLGFTRRPQDIAQLQACASAGQAVLTELYAEILEKRGIACAQVLLTRSDVMGRDSYLNARSTLDTLLDLGAIPVVNENDVVSHTEFSFGDNDMLGALVATMIGADLYVILSDIDGLYTANPATHPDATLIEHVSHIDAHILSIAGGAGSAVGTGGMQSKVRAARACMSAGIPLLICRGREEHALVGAVAGTIRSTRFEAQDQTAETARKLWIGLAGMCCGTLVVDAGAKQALLERGASLLPAGILSCSGSFEPGVLVAIEDSDGMLIGRGLVRYSSDEIQKCHGLKLEVIERFLPERTGDPVVHRDDLLVL